MVIIILFTITLCAYLFLGLYVLVINPKQSINILFFIISMNFVLSSFFAILIQLLLNKNAINILFNVGMTLFLFTLTLLLILSLKLSNLFKLKIIHYIIIFIPTFIFTFLIFKRSPAADFIRYENSWRIINIKDQLLFNLMSIYFIFLIILYILIIIYWRIKTENKKEKRQAIILLFSYSLSTLLGIIYVAIFFNILKLIKYIVFGDSMIFYLFWIAGIFYCIVRYRFLSITPASVSNDIIANIDESIILLDNNCRIITANDKTKVLTSNNKLEAQDLSKLVYEYQEINKEILDMIEGKTKDFSCRLNYLGSDNKKVLMDTKFSLIKDRFDDNIGIMIIGHEVKEIKQLMTIYKITEREAEIIQDIIAGYTNIEIAKNLEITENTIKRHITTIYNKLGIDNKIQLMNLLKDFNLIPEQKAEKTVFLLRKPNNKLNV